jgi:hypothetical protein
MKIYSLQGSSGLNMEGGCDAELIFFLKVYNEDSIVMDK